jgi:hypothetical protein
MGSELFLGFDKSARSSLNYIISEIASPRNVAGVWRDGDGREAHLTMMLMSTVETSDFVIEGQPDLFDGRAHR